VGVEEAIDEIDVPSQLIRACGGRTGSAAGEVPDCLVPASGEDGVVGSDTEACQGCGGAPVGLYDGAIFETNLFHRSCTLGNVDCAAIFVKTRGDCEDLRE